MTASPMTIERTRANSLLGNPAGDMTLRVCGSEHDGKIVRIAAEKCTIGSSRECTLRLRAPGVNRLHCLILRGAAGTIVRRWSRDTRLNGHGFQDAPLLPGDRLSIGPVEFEVLQDHHRPDRQLPGLDACSSAAGTPTEEQDDTRHESLRLARDQQRHRARQFLKQLRDTKRQAAEYESFALEQGREAETLQQRIDALQAKIDEYQQEPSSSDDAEQVSAGTSQTAELQANIDKLESQLRQQRQQHENDQQAWRQQRQQLEEELSQQGDSLARQKAEIESARAELDLQLQRQQRQVEVDNADGARRLAELEQQQQALLESQEVLRLEREEEQQQRQQAEQKLAEQQQQLDQERETLQQQREELERQQSTWQSQQQQSQGDAALLRQQAEQDLAEQQQQLDQQRESLQQQCAELEQQRSAWQSQQQQSQDDAAQLRQQAEQELAEKKQQLEQQEQALQKKQQEIERQQTAWQDQQQETREEAARQSQLIEEQLAELDQQKQTFQEQRQQWQEQQHQTQVELGQQQSRIQQEESDLRQQQEQLEQQQRQWKAERRQAETTLQQQRQELEQKQQELEQQKQELESVRNAIADEQSPQQSTTETQAAPVSESEVSIVETPSAAPVSAANVLASCAQTSPDIKDVPIEEEPDLPEMPETDELTDAPGEDKSVAASDDTVAEQEEEDSIEDYMARLLERVRGEQKSEEPAVYVETPGQAEVKSRVASEPEPEPVEPSPPPPTGEYLPRSIAPEAGTSMEAMRQLANQSARSAIDKSSKKRWGKAVAGKITVSAVAAVVGGALLFLSHGVTNITFLSAIACFLVAGLFGFQILMVSGRFLMKPGKPDRHDSAGLLVSGSHNAGEAELPHEDLGESQEDIG